MNGWLWDRMRFHSGDESKRRIRIRMSDKAGVVEKRLQKKAQSVIHGLQGRRGAKVDDIFDQRFHIAPSDLVVRNYLRPTPKDDSRVPTLEGNFK